MSSIMASITRAAQFSLDWCFSITGNYGLAIILFTVIFTALLTPTRIASVKQMKATQILQPQIKEINEKYKGNPEKINSETSVLWKKYGVNPLLGCLPVLLQLPIFIAVLSVFRTIVFPEGAASAFLWLKDLSVKDPYYILPILAGVASYLQSWASGMTKDPQQKTMSLMMPAMMVWICWSQPSSLGLYWTTSQFCTMGQQVIMNYFIKVEPIVETAVTKK